MRIRGRIDNQDYGMSTATLILFAILLGVASGIVVALLLIHPVARDITRNQNKSVTFFVAVIFPLLAIISSLIIVAFGPRLSPFPFSFLRPGTLEFYSWSFDSQVPAFWLGLVAGWAIQRRG